VVKALLTGPELPPQALGRSRHRSTLEAEIPPPSLPA
jgi:hypothetical protein